MRVNDRLSGDTAGGGLTVGNLLQFPILIGLCEAAEEQLSESDKWSVPIITVIMIIIILIIIIII